MSSTNSKIYTIRSNSGFSTNVMADVYLTPGPTQVHPIVKEAFRYALDSDIGAMSHRSKEYDQLSIHTESQLRTCLNIPRDYRVFFLPSGTESWERIIQNAAEKTTHHFVNGAFSKRFYETSIELGRQPTMNEKPLGRGFDESDLQTKIDAEIICITQNETSTGVRLPDEFVQSIHTHNPNTLLAVDAVSCAPYSKINLNLVDYYFFSVQKFFSMPAGLGVLIVSPRAIEKSNQMQKKGLPIGAHHSLMSLDMFAKKHQTPCTPNVIAIYALGEIAKYLNSIGIEKVRQQTSQKAQMLYTCLDQSKKCHAFVKESVWRSDTVITVDAGANTNRIVDELTDNHLIVGQGYGALKDTQFRVANFFSHTLEDFRKICSILD